MSDSGYWGRTARGLSRRKLLLTTGAAGAGAALAACGGKSGGGSSSSSASSKPSGASSQFKQGGTLTFGATDPAMWKQTDAHKALLIFSVWHWIGRHALTLDPDTKKLQPLTVASWEIPGDGSEFIFKVNPNAKIQNRPPSNGRNFTSQKDNALEHHAQRWGASIQRMRPSTSAPPPCTPSTMWMSSISSRPKPSCPSPRAPSWRA